VGGRHEEGFPVMASVMPGMAMVADAISNAEGDCRRQKVEPGFWNCANHKTPLDDNYSMSRINRNPSKASKPGKLPQMNADKTDQQLKQGAWRCLLL
jgi:hypothetical protein